MEKAERQNGDDDRIGWPEAGALDPVLERFKQDIDFSLVEKNLRLTTQQRAQQLINATRFIKKFRPLVQENHSASAQ